MNIPRSSRSLGDLTITEATGEFSLLAWGVAALFSFWIVLQVTGK